MSTPSATIATQTASGASNASSSLVAQSQPPMALMSDAGPSSAAAGAESSSIHSSMNLGQIKYKDSSNTEVTKQATIIFLDANGQEMNPGEDYLQGLAQEVDRLRGLLSCMIGDQKLTQKDASNLESVDQEGYHVETNRTINHTPNSLTHWEFLLNIIKGTNDSSSSRESSASSPVIPQQPSPGASITNFTPISKSSSASSVVSTSPNEDDANDSDNEIYATPIDSPDSSRSPSPVQTPLVPSMGSTSQTTGAADDELRKKLKDQENRIAQIRLHLSNSINATLPQSSGANSASSTALRALGAGNTPTSASTQQTPTGVRILVASHPTNQ